MTLASNTMARLMLVAFLCAGFGSFLVAGAMILLRF